MGDPQLVSTGASPGVDLDPSVSCFFPSRWRGPLKVAAVAGLLATGASACLLAWIVLAGGREWPWSPLLSTTTMLLTSVRMLRLARRLGVTVDHEGVRLEGGTILNPPGFWRWDEVRSVDVVEEEYVRGAPRQVVLSTRTDEHIRLGPITGRDAMVDQIRARLRSP